MLYTILLSPFELSGCELCCSTKKNIIDDMVLLLKPTTYGQNESETIIIFGAFIISYFAWSFT